MSGIRIIVKGEIRMAFYKDMPDKKAKRNNYGDFGSWEEEGSRYSDRRGNNDGAGRSDRRRSSFEGGNRRADSRPGRAPFNGGNDYRRSDDRSGRPSFNGGNERLSYRKNGAGEHRRENGDERFDFNRSGKGPSQGSRGFKDRNDNHERPMKTANASWQKEENRKYGGVRSGEQNFQRPSERPSFRGDYRDFEYHPAQVQQEEKPAGEENTEAYILGGRNPIREALKNGRDIEKLLVQRGELSGSAREIVQMAKEARVPVQVVEKARLDEITEHHQGMLAFASAYQYATVEEMLQHAEERGEAPFLILLDGVTDPHNLGAVIRTAECVGAHGVIVPERRSVGLTPAAVKASAGAVEHLPVARVTNLNRTIEDLKKKNIWVYAVTMDGDDYESVDFNGGTALVIGAEGEGISRLTVENCDQKVSLPMNGHIDSLNASVAAGIMMYRVLSARKK